MNDKINVKYNNDESFISSFYDKQISDINDLLNINELIKNSYDQYEDNYYKGKNNLRALSSINNSQNINESFQLGIKTKDEDEEIYLKQINLLEYEKKELQIKYDKLEKENNDLYKKYCEKLKEIENLKRNYEGLLNEKKKRKLSYENSQKIHKLPKSIQ